MNTKIMGLAAIGLIFVASLGGCIGEEETTGWIYGAVLDSAAGVNNATITIEGAALSGVTDGNGTYEIRGLAPGNYTVTVEKAGFVKQNKSIVVEAGKGTEASFNLTAAPLVLLHHDERSGSIDTASYLAGERGEFTFPITGNSKRILITFKASSLPSGVTGCGIWVLNADGEEVANEFSSADAEVIIEFKEKQVRSGGVGDWTVYFVPQLPDVMATYSAVVDVYGIE